VTEFSLREVEQALHQSLFIYERLTFWNENLSEWFRVDRYEIQHHVYDFLKELFPGILFPVFYEESFDASSHDQWPELNNY